MRKEEKRIETEKVKGGEEGKRKDRKLRQMRLKER